MGQENPTVLKRIIIPLPSYRNHSITGLNSPDKPEGQHTCRDCALWQSQIENGTDHRDIAFAAPLWFCVSSL